MTSDLWRDGAKSAISCQIAVGASWCSWLAPRPKSSAWDCATAETVKTAMINDMLDTSEFGFPEQVDLTLYQARLRRHTRGLVRRQCNRVVRQAPYKPHDAHQVDVLICARTPICVPWEPSFASQCEAMDAAEPREVRRPSG